MKLLVLVKSHLEMQVAWKLLFEKLNILFGTSLHLRVLLIGFVVQSEAHLLEVVRNKVLNATPVLIDRVNLEILII